MLDWLNARLKRLQAAEAAPPPASPPPPAEPAPPADPLHAQGLAAFDRGELAAAARIFEDMVQASPGDVAAWVALGRVRARAGRLPAAQAAWQRAGELEPHHPALVAELALLALSRGKPEEAEALLAKTSGGTARTAEAHFQLASLLLQRGKNDAAARHLGRAVACDPRHAGAHANLGAVLRDAGRAPEAAAHLEQAVQLAPALSHAAFNLAMLRIDQRQWGSAAALLRQSLAAAPKQADAQYWLGNALMGSGDAEGARKAYQAALRLDANYVAARWGLTMAQLAPIALTEAERVAGVEAFGSELEKLGSWLRAHRPAEGYRAVGAQQPYYLAYSPGNHSAVLGRYGALCASLMAGWARKSGLQPAVPAAGKPQRIGIVSAHVQNHSVWNALVRGWIEHLDPAQFQIEVFHTGAAQDAETQWARKHVARLHQGLGDWSAWAKAIAAGGFDILLYPEIGMDATTVRLSALRLAPVQLASWGHPITTGLPTIDGYISAQALEPADAASHYTEKLLLLPGLGCSYRPYGTPPARVDLAALGIAKGDRVLLCAGISFKYAPADDAALVDVARRCQPCKLVFFREAADTKSERLEQRLRQAFAAGGLAFDDCVRIIPWQSQAAFFGLLRQADVFLDTIGFSGFNTAMQAVECGTPIVAWDGAFMRGRFASGILRELGLDEWIADTPEAFASRAQRLCDEPGLRAKVRERIEQQRSRLFHDRTAVAALARELQAFRTD